MNEGTLYILLATLGWGLWGFFNKAAQGRISAPQISFLMAMDSFITVPIYLKLIARQGGFVWDWKGIVLTMVSGLFAAMATLTYTSALATKNVATVMGITSAYPLVTLALTMIFLNESVTINQLIGFVLVVVGVIFLSI